MSELPEPLVSPEVDLRDFAFMPLDVVRLRDSDLAATPDGEVFRAAVLAWCASWHQVPAASLPDDDAVLARLLGYGRDVKGWKKLRDAGALKGFRLCRDGRLYHDVVAEKARDAWTGKLRQRWSTECARIKKHNDRHKTDIARPDFDEWVSLGCPWGQPLFVPGDTPQMSPGTDWHCPSVVPGETGSKGEGEGQGYRQGQGEKKKDIKKIVSQVVRASSPDAQAKHPTNFDDPANRKARWQQKIESYLYQTLPDHQAKRIVIGYVEGEKWAVEKFEEADRAMKARKQNSSVASPNAREVA